MKSFGIFTRHAPEKSRPTEIWLKNENGADFYALRNYLSAMHAGHLAGAGIEGADEPLAPATYVTLTKERVIATANNDVDLLFPQELELVAIDRVDEPRTLIGKVLQEDGAIVERPKPSEPDPVPSDPVEKMKAFLAANPDVRALLP